MLKNCKQVTQKNLEKKKPKRKKPLKLLMSPKYKLHGRLTYLWRKVCLFIYTNIIISKSSQTKIQHARLEVKLNYMH